MWWKWISVGLACGLMALCGCNRSAPAPQTGGMAIKAASILRALAGGVRAVHIIDGRSPHNVIAELFTDTGVGTIIRRDDAEPAP